VRAAGEGKVLFLNHAANETGPPVVLLALQRWMAEHAPDVPFATVHGAGGGLLGAFEALGPTTVLHRRWGPDVVVGAVLLRAHQEQAARAAAVQAARARLVGATADLVVVNALAPVNLVSLRALRPTVPVVSHVHELSVILEHGLAPDDLALALRTTDHFVVVSDAVARYLHDRHRVATDRMTMVHEFIEPPPPADELAPAAAAVRAELGLAADAPLVVGCGSTDWRKAPDLFVRLAWEQRRLRPDLPITFAWVGNTSNAYGDHLVQWEVERLGLQDVVRFVGVRADPRPWFAAADVFVLPSREDPFPLVCIEAAACGTPIVCFDNGGIPELVEPAGAGEVAPYPDVTAMAGAVARLLDDPAERAAAGARGAAFVRAELLAEHLAPRFHQVVLDQLAGPQR
jgi:glycosyltransferase involved in cell wall biosynthesis